MSYTKPDSDAGVFFFKSVAVLAFILAMGVGTVARGIDFAQQQEAARQRAEQQQRQAEERERQQEAARERAEQQQRLAEERERQQQEAARRQAEQIQQQQEAARQQAEQAQRQSVERMRGSGPAAQPQRIAPVGPAHPGLPQRSPGQPGFGGQPYHGPNGTPVVKPGGPRHPEFPTSPSAQPITPADLSDIRAQTAQLKLQLQSQLLQDVDNLIQTVGNLLIDAATPTTAPADASLADSVQDLLPTPPADSLPQDQLSDQVTNLLSDKTDPASPDAPDAYPNAVADAQKAITSGDFLEAFSAARRAVAARPDGYQGHYLAAYAAWKLNQLDKARAEADRALQLAPPNVKIEAKVLVDAVQADPASPR